MTELEEATDRMRHAQSLIESVADTVEGQADVQALNRAVGLLEQAEADVADFRESE